jgi:hypothetical protein
MALSAIGALTKEQVKSIFEAPLMTSRAWTLRGEDPWPLYVYYLGGRTTFVPRDRFMMSQPEEPNDCVWIVPGSIERS